MSRPSGRTKAHACRHGALKHAAEAPYPSHCTLSLGQEPAPSQADEIPLAQADKDLPKKGTLPSLSVPGPEPGLKRRAIVPATSAAPDPLAPQEHPVPLIYALDPRVTAQQGRLLPGTGIPPAEPEEQPQTQPANAPSLLPAPELAPASDRSTLRFVAIGPGLSEEHPVGRPNRREGVTLSMVKNVPYGAAQIASGVNHVRIERVDESQSQSRVILCDFFHYSKVLESVHLCRVTPAIVGSFAGWVPGTVTSISLCHQQISDQTLAKLTENAKRLVSLSLHRTTHVSFRQMHTPVVQCKDPFCEFLRHLPPTLESLLVVATAVDLEALAKEIPRLKALRALRIEGDGIYTDPAAMDKVLCALKKDGPISVSVGACTHVGILAFFENNPAYNTFTFERRGPIEPLLREKKLDMSIAPDRRDDFVRDLIEEFGAKLREKTDLFDCVTIDGEPFTRTEMFRNALRIADGLAAIDATVEAPDA